MGGHATHIDTLLSQTIFVISFQKTCYFKNISYILTTSTYFKYYIHLTDKNLLNHDMTNVFSFLVHFEVWSNYIINIDYTT